MNPPSLRRRMVSNSPPPAAASLPAGWSMSDRDCVTSMSQMDFPGSSAGSKPSMSPRARLARRMRPCVSQTTKPSSAAVRIASASRSADCSRRRPREDSPCAHGGCGSSGDAGGARRSWMVRCASSSWASRRCLSAMSCSRVMSMSGAASFARFVRC
jgi:hypothetical protein